MRLRHAVLRQVRQHKHLQLSFHPRFTLIGGPNEAGKSTLVEALHKGLFLKATATGRGVEELRSRLHSGLPEVEIGFEAGGSTWLLRKRFSGASGTCQLSNTSGVALSGAAAEERLAALLGVDGAIEGRRIGQLPQRWAHLWVRQGEAGSNLLSGPGAAYDLERLVQQLQQQGPTATLESPLDRLVDERIRQHLDGLFTATGKVKAGSPLAQAQERVKEAQGQLGQALERQAALETAMEELRAIGLRLKEIDEQERPALAAQRQLDATLQLRRAEAKPIRQQWEALRQAQQSLHNLELQLTSQRSSQSDQQRQLQTSQQDLQHQDQALVDQRQALESLQAQARSNQERQQLAQHLLALDNLDREAQQLQAHKDQFSQLQQEAEQWKAELAALPAIGSEQVRALRQAEQRLAEAQARCQAMATHLTVLEADQPVMLGGQELVAGQEVQLSRAEELAIGPGVRLRISPGGGDATANAEQQRDLCHQQLQQLQGQLGVASSDAAEPLAQRRQVLEAELKRLRQAASAIPWAKLDAQLAELEPRRLRFEQALGRHAALQAQLQTSQDLPTGRDQLEAWLEKLRAASQQLGRDQQGLEQNLQQAQHQLEQRRANQRALETSLEQLAGGLFALEERRLLLEHNHGKAEALAHQLEELQGQLAQHDQAIEALESQRHQGEVAARGHDTTNLDQRSQLLDAEKDNLLTAKGHNEQLCLSLSAIDPQAEVAQRQAELEAAEAERERIHQQADAWVLLQTLLHQARREIAERYSEPLGQAIGRYLTDLGPTPQQVALGFDPKAGFGALQLQQGEQCFDFEELSGGMREQLAAALRLAMAEVLQPAYDNSLPLVFDDAFTNSDPERLSGLGEMLRKGSEAGIQIVLLSCNPRDYAPLAQELGAVVNL